ncbi:nucleotidyltransferase family protein [Mucilaginibacter sp. KACC 22773]|uniref:nucleotidyltransferase family protein n=1 Tax=Mucilaginibacter sp. KACC 22773 TaxID=3025671 RepID=UPI002365A83D|nr:nucleotidyltransferase family protein [Mucilaginibacter sp. KACC 22773]WDF77219.1 nucleotidyltransferase family protein [Mucilaginibacter sp. KACC 22773]
MEQTTGIIILAAGNSARLGHPKQLLKYKNSTLLNNIIGEALLLPESSLTVVTGAYNEFIKANLNIAGLKLCFNPDWQSGMGSSIVCGLKDLLLRYPKMKKCIFLVCDQPYVTNTLLKNLLKEYGKTRKRIVASAYSDTLGTPVLFHRKYFGELLKLRGQEGAKKLINAHSDDIATVHFEKGVVDIDTAEDYHKLINP